MLTAGLVGTALIATPGGGAPAEFEEASGSKQVGLLTSDVETAPLTIKITPSLLLQLMQDDLDSQREYVELVTRVRGAAAGQAAVDSISSPYKRKIEAVQAEGGELALEIELVTLGDRLSFSAVSFDGGLTAKDPVSIVFFGNANPAAIYRELTGSRETQLQDHNGPLAADGVPSCHSQTQWVLMGAAGGELRWRRSALGVGSGACASGTRDHVRFFGELVDAEFGTWFVATPHREEWTNRGHVIRNWNEPSRNFVQLWASKGAGLSDLGFLVSQPTWALCKVQTDGIYQDTPFDGQAAVIYIP